MALGLLRDATRHEILSIAQDLLDRHKSWPSHTPGHRELLGMIRTEIERVRRMLVAGDPTETDYFSDLLLH